MAIAVTMPQMGESVVEGTVTRWYKAIGEPVEKLEPLFEIATDKIDTDVPAPASGVLLAILVEDGTTVEAGSVLGYIGAAGEDVPGQAEAGQASMSDAPKPAPPSTQLAASGTVAKPSGTEETRPRGRDFISPVVARLAAEHELDLSQITGTGLGGRITKKDVLIYLERGLEEPAQPAAASRPGVAPASADEETLLHPLTTMRKAIAAHMVASKQTSPHVTSVMEADMTAVVRHREAHKAAAAAKGAPLTFTPYFVAAAVAGLRAEPVFNSRFTAEGILESRRIHIGVAVALDEGLLVPVIRDADEKSLTGLARCVADLVQQARTGALAPDELTGGTFTVSNHGTGGSLVAMPIINQPQAGILGAGVVVKRPVVQSGSASLLPSADDAIVIRPMCYLSLTFDHRLADGAQADRFLAHICKTLENWPSE